MVKIKRTWLYGLSIYPASYLLIVIFKLINGENALFGIHGSILEWLIIFFSQWILDQFWGGLSLTQLRPMISALLFLGYIVFAVLINAACFALIVRSLPVKWKPVLVTLLYIMFLAFNCYIPDIGF